MIRAVNEPTVFAWAPPEPHIADAIVEWGESIRSFLELDEPPIRGALWAYFPELPPVPTPTPGFCRARAERLKVWEDNEYIPKPITLPEGSLLTVVRQWRDRGTEGYRYWVDIVCSCGTTRTISRQHAVTGHAMSCGHLRRRAHGVDS